MKTYGLNTDIRRKILVGIFLISLLTGGTLYTPLNNGIDFLHKKVSWISSFLNSWDYLGIVPTQLTVIAIFGFLTNIFDNHLWKTKLINRFLDVPNLNGVWEGKLNSIRTENGQEIEKKIDMTLTIKQTWRKMSCYSEFKDSDSESEYIHLDTDNRQNPVLIFIYSNQSSDVNCKLPRYLGYNELKLRGNKLSGQYFTNRDPSTKGTIALKKVRTV